MHATFIVTSQDTFMEKDIMNNFTSDRWRPDGERGVLLSVPSAGSTKVSSPILSGSGVLYTSPEGYLASVPALIRSCKTSLLCS